MLFGQGIWLAQQLRKIAERIMVSHPFRRAGFANSLQRDFLEVEHLFDHHRRNRVAAHASAHNQRLGDSQRQRDIEPELSALVRRRHRFNTPPQASDFGFDDVHPHATARNLRDLIGRRKTRCEDKIGKTLGIAFVVRDQSSSNTASTDALEIKPRAVIGQAQDNFIAFLPQHQLDITNLGFAFGNPFLATLNTVRHGITQHVLERRAHLFQNAPVKFDLPTLDIKINALAQFLTGLPHDPVETVGEAGKRHHAHRHQLLLQIAIQSGLSDNRRVGIVKRLEKVLLHRRNVVHRLRHHAGQFLEAGETVKLKRIELRTRFIGLCSSRLHLRFGLNLDLTQLAPQTDYVFGQIEQRVLETAHFTFDTRPRNRQLACLVDQSINQIGAHAQHRPLRSGINLGLGLVHTRPIRATLDNRWRFLYVSCNSRRRRRFSRCGGLIKGLTLLQALDDLLNGVKGRIQFVNQLRRHSPKTRRIFNPRFKSVGDIPQAHGARHPRTTFQRVEKASQDSCRFDARGRRAPSTQLGRDVLVQIDGFLKEDRQQLLINLIRDLRQHYRRGHCRWNCLRLKHWLVCDRLFFQPDRVGHNFECCRGTATEPRSRIQQVKIANQRAVALRTSLGGNLR